ncbi:MAG: N-6 DNA methylase [Myxococcota bacterium]
MSQALVAALGRAESALRARGLTGGQAFDVLLGGVKARLGLGPAVNGPGAEVAATLPLDAGHDLVGLAYERFFPDLFKGRHGQYFTPGPIVRLLFATLPIRARDVVVDPACGSGALLAEAAARGARVRGFDVDLRLVELARLGLSLRGADAEVCHGDLFVQSPEPCDVLVANPPFSVRLSDPDVLGRYTLGQGRASVLSDQLFVEAMERWVRPGGWAGVVLPYSVLVNASFANVRERIDAHWRRHAVIALPEGVFRPFGGAAGRAAVLILQRGSASGTVRWADVSDPGYDVRRQQVRPTSTAEIDALVNGEGWQTLPAGVWVPPSRPHMGHDARRVGEVATARRATTCEAPAWVVDLGDVVRRTGESLPRQALQAPASRRRTLHQGDVLVARMRPNLGNVTWLTSLPPGSGGSPEWIALTPQEAPGYLWHALRTPTWREHLPRTGGQTRPRTDAEAVLASEIRWPDEATAKRVHAVSTQLTARREADRKGLEAIQQAVDDFAAGALDASEFAAEIDRLAARYEPLPDTDSNAR